MIRSGLSQASYSSSSIGGGGGGGGRVSSQRAASVYAGAGSRSVRVSYASNNRSGGGSFDLSDALGGMGGGGANDKATMQNLNDRLATYLDKVRSLESANAQLELQIREWYEKRRPQTRDYSNYEAIIADLRAKILLATMDNARILLQIDNARLAADDFKLKYDNEHQIRQSVETDIIGLRKVRDDLTVGSSDLEMQIEGLNEELVYLKKNHEEELALLRSQMSSGSVNVEVDAPAQQELSTVMETIRSQYEGIADKNRKEMEAWYKVKFDEVNKVVTTSVNTLNSSQTQITDLKRTLQSLQIELQSQTSQKSALEGQLEETEGRYNVQLSQLQAMVNCLESELSQVRMDIERQGKEYQILLDIKTRLELEIAEYRRLLDGESVTKAAVVAVVKREPVVTKRVKMVVEQIIDGKVVSHTEEVDEEIISQ